MEASAGDRFWRRFFWIAALYNFAAGLPIFLWPGFALGVLGAPADGDTLFLRLASFFVCVFGVGYATVARDLRQWGVVVVGTLGKLGAVLLVASAWLAGEIGTVALALVAGDAVFCLFFLAFLLRGAR